MAYVPVPKISKVHAGDEVCFDENISPPP